MEQQQTSEEEEDDEDEDEDSSSMKPMGMFNALVGYVVAAISILNPLTYSRGSISVPIEDMRPYPELHELINSRQVCRLIL